MENSNRAVTLGAILIGLLAVAAMVGNRAVETRGSPSAQPQKFQLELINSRAEGGYGWMTVSGLVKNISSEPMENVTAVALFYDENGNYITNGESLIDYSPILPGQESPFSVMARENPAIAKWKVEFKEFFGGTIPHRDLTP